MIRDSVQTKMLQAVLKRAKHGTIVLTLPDGSHHAYGDEGPIIRVEIKTTTAINLLFKRGDLGLAEAIISGEIVVDNEAALIEWACRNERDLQQAIYGTKFGIIAAKIKRLFNRNDRAGAKKNIVAHYDLGNSFYQLWLDPTMSYSSAVYKNESANLQEAQLAKYDRIIEQLDIRAGDHVLEIGCGWGGFFKRAVEKTGCKVTAVMNSAEQARYNRANVVALKLGEHVNVVEQDYRDIGGSYDKVVSIEMIEAVGEQYWDPYFSKISQSLKPGGHALIQGITIRDELFSTYRKSTDFIQQFIFPGGMLPTAKIIDTKCADHSLRLADQYFFGQDYARTLKTWRENFNKALPQVNAMGFDENFIRTWNLYLSYCEGAFRAERINVGQFLLKKAD